MGQTWGKRGARGALHCNTWGVAYNSRAPLIPGDISPGSSDLPSSKDQRLEAGLSQLFPGDGQGMTKGQQQSLPAAGFAHRSPSPGEERAPEVSRAHQHISPSPFPELSLFLPPAAPTGPSEKGQLQVAAWPLCGDNQVASPAPSGQPGPSAKGSREQPL